MPSTQVIRHQVVIGDEKNYFKVSEQGEISYAGKGSTWEDIQTSLVGRQLSTTAGSVDNNYAEQSVTFNPNGIIGTLNDMVGINVQKPHKAKPDSELRFHIHWWQVDAVDREFTVRYRVQDPGEPKETGWTTVVVSTNANNMIPYVSGTINQITKLVDVDMSPYGLSALVQVQITRSDSVAGDIDATFLDAHYEIDSTGSSEEFTK